MALSRFGGTFNAGAFAYGINPQVPPLMVTNGPNATGSAALTLAYGALATVDGTTFSAPNTNAPIIVGGSTVETVTPSSVSNSTPLVLNTCLVTATYVSLHGNGDLVRSGTVGLQEAINYANSVGGGIVVVDNGWANLGGTTAMLVAATWPGGVRLLDNRFGAGTSATSVVLTNAQILALSSTAVTILPAPGAGYFYNILKATVVNESGGTAYSGGGAITIGYGTAANTQALSGTIAATFLTTPTVAQVIQLQGVNMASTTEALYDNLPITMNCATANFTTGSGTLRVSMTYTLESK